MIAVQEFKPVPLAADAVIETGPPVNWLWEGYLGRGNITLLTSYWKSGKTTLLAGLLHQMAAGGTLLGKACPAARALIVSEEQYEQWEERKREIPIGSHAELLARPFRTRPTPEQWNRLVDYARARRTAGELDLFIVDSLRKFLPGSSESDPATLMEMLDPLQSLASEGVAVLLLHHPRKAASAEGHSARGSGALLAYVDIILEMHPGGKLRSDFCARRLVALSRHRATPPQVWFEWLPGTPTFHLLPEPHVRRFQANWDQLLQLLKLKETSVTHHELLNDWPPDVQAPSATVLYDWLNRATAAKLVRRSGHGTKRSPYQYRLPNKNDEYYDRGELPPLEPMSEFFKRVGR